MNKLTFITILTITLYSCNQDAENNSDQKIIADFVELPTDLSNIDDSVFIHLDEWLKDAEMIGISEGEHGMNESMDFRNSYIKYLVRTNQVQVLAFESGLLESRLVDNYIQGKDLHIDTVLTNGFSYTFGQFEQSRELIEWLRKTNATRSSEKRVRFYGFDMAGSAPNPYLEKASYSLQECLNYLKEVDPKLFNEYTAEANQFIPYLRAVDNPENKGVSFVDMSEDKRATYLEFLENLRGTIEKNKQKYILKLGEELYQWGLQTAVCSKQNFTFLIGYHQPKADHSSRERFMVENIKWIRKKEGNKKIALFAHLSHLAKDISRIDENGNNTQPETMFGEHMQAEFGTKYKVVGNMFRYLDFYNDIDSVKVNSVPEILHTKYKSPNFCLRVDTKDSLFLKPQIYGAPFKGDLWMTPSKGVDVIFYTEKQHFFYKE